MPEYLSPGVYVEEVSFRAKFIEGVSTSTAGIVGQTSFGPPSGRPEIITSFSEFRRRYGGWDDLTYQDGTTRTNFTAHGVRAFFDNGGQRLYVSRVFKPNAGSAGRATLGLPGAAGTTLLQARYPGSWGNRLRVTVQLMPRKSATNLIGRDLNNNPVLRGVYKGAVVQASSTVHENAGDVALALPTDPAATLLFVDLVNGLPTLVNAGGVAQPLPNAAYLVEFQVQVFVGDQRVPEANYPNLTVGAEAPNFIGTFLDENEPADADAMVSLTGLSASYSRADSVTLLRYLLNSLTTPGSSFTGTMTGGNDGDAPVPSDYQGLDDDLNPTGLFALGRIDDISIVMAPDAAVATAATGFAKYNNHVAINNALIAHCEQLRYRFAVLDEPANVTSGTAQQFRSQFDSSYAALYYPWVKVVDPRPEKNGKLLTLPPSGFMAGIYARTDVRRGVWKSPANEVVTGAVDFEAHINKGVQDVLNPAGINCLRFFEDGGYRVWGARTVSSDPEWKYVNVRRLFLFLERSIDRGTQWVVFEPNNERTWANVQHTIEAFLLSVWKSGALMGTKPEEAFFVKCDRSTMSQNDLDNGRLVCLIGVAPAYPAEFVIFRIGQWTGDTKAA